MGGQIEEKLKEPDCGVVGFVGSVIKPAVYSGWDCGPEYEVSHYHYIDKQHRHVVCTKNISETDRFKEVITLDGFGLFVRKDVFEKYPFDEKHLTGFHCYDLDFTMQITRSGLYRNWCFYSEVIHLSNGNFSKEWVDSIVSIHNKKWSEFLPLHINGNNLTVPEIQKLNEKTLWLFFKNALTAQSPLQWDIFKTFCQLPLSCWHINKIISGLWKLCLRRLPDRGCRT